MTRNIKIGIIGTNFISDFFVSGAKELGKFELHSVYSRRQETGRQFADRHGIPAVYDDMEAFLSDSALEAVYIASPNSLHCDQAVAAMNHGKHVLVEKPIASNFAELARMEEASRKNSVVMMEAMRAAYLPGYAWVRRNLPRLGQIRGVHFQFCQYSSRYDRFKNGEILNAFNPELSNAAVMDIGVYAVYLFLMLFGRPKRVHAASVRLSNGFEGCGTALFTYPDMVGTLSWSKITAGILPSVIEGENGTLSIDHLTQFQHGVLALRSGETEHFEDDTAKDINMIYELEVFQKLIDGEFDGDILAVSRLCMEMLDEIRRQAEIHFPADKGELR